MHYESRVFEISFPDSLLDFREIPAATKYIAICYVCLTVTLYVSRVLAYNDLKLSDPNLEFSSVVNPLLQMIPSELLKYPISIVTSNLIDTEIWKFIVNLLNLLIGGAYIEKNWNSSKEVLKFVFIIGSITNLITVIVTNTLSFILPGIKLNVPLDGNYTVIIGFPIIYKQLLPETTIINLKKPLTKNFRFKLLPILIMTLMTVMQLIWFHHFAHLLSIWISFICCWVYLRFYQELPVLNNSSQGIKPEENNIVKGDASDPFQLIYFFPDTTKPILKPIFNGTYDLVCNKLKLIEPFQMEDIDKGNDIAQKRGAKKDSTSVEERRRQLALQVLQERMS